MPKDRKERDKSLVICRCESHCLRPNPATGEFVGSGERVRIDVRVRHRRDDRLRRLLQSLQPRTRTPIIGPDMSNDDWLTSIRAEVEVLSGLPALLPGIALQFCNNPHRLGVGESELNNYNPTYPPNTGVYALRSTADVNRTFIHLETRLWELHRLLSTFDRSDGVEEAEDGILELLHGMERDKRMEWINQYTLGLSSNLTPYVNTSLFFQAPQSSSRAVFIVSLVALALQYHYFLSRRGCELYLAGAHDILKSRGTSNRTLENVPLSPRSLTSAFHLDPIVTTYISCTSCHCLYLYNPVNPERNPNQCTFQKTPTSTMCGGDLWVTIDRGSMGPLRKPIRLYYHQDLKYWLGRLLTRPGLEDTLTEYPRSQLDPASGPFSPNSEICDIWQARVLRTLKDLDGQPFIGDNHEALRLVFGLSVDGFDPFGNKAAKQSAAATGIWMVLYNLPPHLRYLPQNMYLAGIIPGPTKPSSDEINHYTQLVVNDLKEIWNPGIFFSRTYNNRNGRSCRGMLVPLICDLLGARQVIGYPGSTTAHYFCTACDLDVDDISCIDRTEWPCKDKAHIRRYAQLYRDAHSEDEQASLFEACGWRWSPLFELDYWDVVQFTVIDSMHTLDLNLLQNHVRNLFRIDMKNDGGTALRPPSNHKSKRVVDDKSELRNLERCQGIIYENAPHLLYELLEYHRKILYTFCFDYDIRSPGHSIVVGTRWILAKAIYLWRQQTPASSESLQLFLARHPHLTPTQNALAQGGDKADEGEHESSSSDDEDPKHSPQSPPQLPKQSIVQRRARSLIDFAMSNAPSDTERTKIYRQLNTSILAHFCDHLAIDRKHISLSSKGAKQTLFDLVLGELQIDFQRNLLGLIAANAPSTASYAFLGKDIMEHVWEDMKRTRLPTWITRPPRDWGTARRGKLSADNWRTICCIHLPITLIRLFGEASGRQRELLDNFMKLIAAVRVATMHRSSSQQIQRYNTYIQEYTVGVKELFPDYQILPSHHAALHLGDVMEQFGPKHAHDSPYYERYIKFFHRMNTNNKMGQLEGTLVRTAARHANLTALLHDTPSVKQDVSQMLDRLEVHEKERLRGFRLGEVLDPFASQGGSNELREEPAYLHTLPPFEYQCLSNILGRSREDSAPVLNKVEFVDSISDTHNVYATDTSVKYRDSGILFRVPSGEEEAGIIRKIFLHRHKMSSGAIIEDKYLVVQQFRKKPIDNDSYRQYGHAGGFSCHLEMGQYLVLNASSVISHVAITNFHEDEYIHILPINRFLLSYELDWLDQPAEDGALREEETSDLEQESLT